MGKFKRKSNFKVNKDLIVYGGSIILVFVLIIVVPMFIGNKESVSDKEDPSENKESKSNEELEIKSIDIKDCENIKVYISNSKKVVNMKMDDYLTGVVAAEMPAAFDEEALKAQVVAARTFAINHILYKPCNKSKEADICDSVHCQVYVDKEKKIEEWSKNKGEEYWSKIKEAVESTENEVLSYKGKLVEYPQYFAVSGGRTEDSKEVFSIDVPYLKSKESKGEEVAPKFSSSLKIKNSELIKKINNAYPKCNINQKNLASSIKINSRTEGGNVKEITVGNENVTGIEFRQILGLNSANFTIDIQNTYSTINCLGYGHGVGMSQWGANVKAKEGKSYKEILEYYYEGVNVEKIDK